MTLCQQLSALPHARVWLAKICCYRLLRAELANFDIVSSDADWYASQIAFLRAHRYWTATARCLRTAGKRRNIVALAALQAHGAR